MKIANNEYPDFPSKSKAKAYVKSLGFTELFDTTESGDHGYGSREYYRKPGGFVKGVDAGVWACISKVGPDWLVSFR